MMEEDEVADICRLGRTVISVHLDFSVSKRDCLRFLVMVLTSSGLFHRDKSCYNVKVAGDKKKDN